MNRKIIGIIIILSGALLLIGVVYIVFFDSSLFSDLLSRVKKNKFIQDKVKIISKKEPEQYIPVKSQPKKIIAKNISNKEQKEDKPDLERAEQEDLMRMAASFTERFGSYSNQSNFSNIVDLKIFMSQRMKNWADAFIRTQRQKEGSSDIYFGIITRSIAQEVKDIDDYLGTAAILVKTRRREASGSTNNVSNEFDQNIIINFTKERGAWKVDTANWQEE